MIHLDEYALESVLFAWFVDFWVCDLQRATTCCWQPSVKCSDEAERTESGVRTLCQGKMNGSLLGGEHPLLLRFKDLKSAGSRGKWPPAFDLCLLS